MKRVNAVKINPVAHPGSDFINPYNFIRTPVRSKGPSELADQAPPDRGAWAEDTYSGVIPITITARTPILLPDQARATPPTNTLPRLLSTRRRYDTDQPLLLGSSVKGMLRSAYEAITNSRFGIFQQDDWSEALALRNPPQAALDLIMGYVSAIDSNDLPELTIITRCHPTGPLPQIDGRSVDVVACPSLPHAVGQAFATASGSTPSALDRTEVHAWIVLREHAKPRYAYWRVERLWWPSDPAPPVPPSQIVGIPPIMVRGLIHWNGAIHKGKHDERLVPVEILSGHSDIDFSDAVIPAERVKSLTQAWKQILLSYRTAHNHDTSSPDSLGSHIRNQELWRLSLNRTFHYRRGGSGRTELISPTMIGREPFAAAPWDLLDPSHRPAETIDQLSPADRVFGWVPAGRRDDSNATGWKGLLEVESPEVIQASIERVGPDTGLPLATLAEPKPSQYRFYSSSDDKNAPSGQGKPKSTIMGFKPGRDHLRGRKVYLPHVSTFKARGYWTAVDSGGGMIREYLRVGPGNPKLDSNVTDWIAPGAQFRTTIRVAHLTKWELGALLWLLTLPENACLGLGAGKPLGFGAVHVSVAQTDGSKTQSAAETGSTDPVVDNDDAARADGAGIRLFSSAQERVAYYGLTDSPQSLSQAELTQLADDYEELLLSHPQLESVHDEFMCAVLGYTGVPVHYPRTSEQEQDRGQASPGEADEGSELYRWWQANERLKEHLGLPPLKADHTVALPLLSDR